MPKESETSRKIIAAVKAVDKLIKDTKRNVNEVISAGLALREDLKATKDKLGGDHKEDKC